MMYAQIMFKNEKCNIYIAYPVFNISVDVLPVVAACDFLSCFVSAKMATPHFVIMTDF